MTSTSTLQYLDQIENVCISGGAGTRDPYLSGILRHNQLDHRSSPSVVLYRIFLPPAAGSAGVSEVTAYRYTVGEESDIFDRPPDTRNRVKI